MICLQQNAAHANKNMEKKNFFLLLLYLGPAFGLFIAPNSQHPVPVASYFYLRHRVNFNICVYEKVIITKLRSTVRCCARWNAKGSTSGPWALFAIWQTFSLFGQKFSKLYLLKTQIFKLYQFETIVHTLAKIKFYSFSIFIHKTRSSEILCTLQHFCICRFSCAVVLVHFGKIQPFFLCVSVLHFHAHTNRETDSFKRVQNV